MPAVPMRGLLARCRRVGRRSFPSCFRRSYQEFPDRAFGGIGDRHFPPADQHCTLGIDAHGCEVGVEQVAMIDFAIDDRRAVGVGLADDRSRLNAGPTQDDAPGGFPNDRGRSRD